MFMKIVKILVIIKIITHIWSSINQQIKRI